MQLRVQSAVRRGAAAGPARVAAAVRVQARRRRCSAAQLWGAHRGTMAERRSCVCGVPWPAAHRALVSVGPPRALGHARLQRRRAQVRDAEARAQGRRLRGHLAAARHTRCFTQGRRYNDTCTQHALPPLECVAADVVPIVEHVFSPH